MQVDLRGLSCPIPATTAKQMLDRGEKELVFLVDCGASIENVSRVLNQGNREFTTVSHDGWYEIAVKDN